MATVAAPVLARTMIAPLTGFVEALEEREEGARAVVLVETLGTLAPEGRPQRVRVSYKGARVQRPGLAGATGATGPAGPAGATGAAATAGAAAATRTAIRPGDFIAASARLLPPPEPARPGGYDFARDAFFRGIGAVGSLTGTIQVRDPPRPAPLDLRLAAAIDDARNALTRRMAAAAGGQAGAVAAALVTGKRGLIDPASNDALRAAGIYHVVSISGLHMVLAAGVVFQIVRGLLALVPVLALTWPIKKIAAALAMIGVTAYCAFSGWDIAAERSLIMTLVMLGATLVDRPALSMRNLALSALIALAREPEGLLGPSFQMSFGAVAGLIAFSRYLSGRLWSDEGAGPVGRTLSFAAASVLGSLATTVVATLATAPFSAYHFQNLQPFGVVGNLLTLPLISVVVMPAAVIGLLAAPFALDGPVWWVMGLAVQGMLAVSHWIAGFRGAIVIVPAAGTATLGLLSAAILVATLCVSRLRRLALLPAALGLALGVAPERPDLYVDRDGGAAALRGASGRLVVLGRAPPFVLEQWLHADGDARDRADPGLAEGARQSAGGRWHSIGGGGTGQPRGGALARPARARRGLRPRRHRRHAGGGAAGLRGAARHRPRLPRRARGDHGAGAPGRQPRGHRRARAGPGLRLAPRREPPAQRGRGARAVRAVAGHPGRPPAARGARRPRTGRPRRGPRRRGPRVGSRAGSQAGSRAGSTVGRPPA